MIKVISLGASILEFKLNRCCCLIVATLFPYILNFAHVTSRTIFYVTLNVFQVDVKSCGKQPLSTMSRGVQQINPSSSLRSKSLSSNKKVQPKKLVIKNFGKFYRFTNLVVTYGFYILTASHKDTVRNSNYLYQFRRLNLKTTLEKSQFHR